MCKFRMDCEECEQCKGQKPGCRVAERVKLEALKRGRRALVIPTEHRWIGGATHPQPSRFSF